MKRNIFFNLTFVTLILIYLVILAGSVVRATGSGMGCPDWPKCFERWIPPTELSQLPENYKEIFLKKRLRKVEKFTGLLSSLGMDDLAEQIKGDEKIKEEEEFVASKTWIEYINRLLGFMAGNLMILMCIVSLLLWKEDKRLFLFSFLTLIFTSIQGWFGSIVVASNLTPWTITFHMLFALIVIYLLVKILSFKDKEKVQIDRSSKIALWGVFLITIFQIYIGTQVRQELDMIIDSDIVRSSWIENLPFVFEFHRSFAIFVILINGYLLSKFIKPFRAVSLSIGLLLLVEVLSGIVMAYFEVPKVAQPTHLLLATLLFGFYSYLLVMIEKRTI